MGLATLAGKPFRINPRSVSWDWTVKTNATPTLGGKVVQVIGVEAGDITVVGEFGIGGWEEQQEFLVRMKALADAAVANASVAPLRFLWADFSWDFQVWLKAFKTLDGPASVKLSNKVVSPTWQLQLQIVEDNLSLRQVAADLYIARLSDGLGWKQSQYNGGIGFEDLQAALGRAGVSTIGDYFAVAYGADGGVPLGNITTPTIPSTEGEALTWTEAAQIVMSAGFQGNALVTALSIAMAESGLKPRAFRPESENSGGGRDRGLFQINSKANPQYANDEEMFDPLKNSQAAWALSRGGTYWNPWYSFDGKKLERTFKYRDEATLAARQVGGL